MKSYPHLGLSGKGKVEEDKDLIKNAKVLGELLVEAMEGSYKVATLPKTA